MTLGAAKCRVCLNASQYTNLISKLCSFFFLSYKNVKNEDIGVLFRRFVEDNQGHREDLRDEFRQKKKKSPTQTF